MSIYFFLYFVPLLLCCEDPFGKTNTFEYAVAVIAQKYIACRTTTNSGS